MMTNSITTLPTWLETPPPYVSMSPPVKTRSQELPFQELTWENFERLCLRLARREATVEHCQLYGEPGQKQAGIDLYARQRNTSTYRVYQCKRVKAFGKAKIEAAVEKFLTSEWATKSDTFILCSSGSFVDKERADTIEAQRKKLQAKGVTFIVWDRSQLSALLKDHPKIVDDFFGRAWVTEFCGPDVAQALGQRLDAVAVTEFRARMAAFYDRVFAAHDPGLPTFSGSSAQGFSLLERFVLPDVQDQRTIEIVSQVESTRELWQADNITRFHLEHPQYIQKVPTPTFRSVVYQHRLSADQWLANSARSVILGGPGTGKSSLLRFLALDLLQPSPQLHLLTQQWGNFLPVWLPFALWTRLIDEAGGAGCPLQDVLHAWFKSWNEERLWPLVAQALEDERLLLLVDGLDECTNEAVGRIAIQLLAVFANQRNTPVVVTSRPRGFQQLRVEDVGWQVGELADFSSHQQVQLAHNWFTHWVKSTSTTSPDDETVKRRASLDVRGFLADLRKSSDLRDLARVPLLLSLLIYLRLKNARLPDSRFKAYALVIEHLLSTHPNRRASAAFLTTSPFELSNTEVTSLFGALAYELHSRSGEGVIEKTEACRFIEHLLVDSEGAFGLDTPLARRLSRQIIDVGEATIGLLVHVSTRELRFFHRSSQEYLVADHLSRRPLAEQLAIVTAQCASPHWREVLLALFSMTSRAEDIRQFLQQIDSKTFNVAEQYDTELLLTEVACGEFACPAATARQLLQRAVTTIEQGLWMPHRERLLRIVLEGLRSAKVRDLVKVTLARWFPQRVRWLDGLYRYMTRWPSHPAVIQALRLGFHADNAEQRRSAADALAKVAAGDRGIGEDIGQVAITTHNADVRAAAFRCLLKGWKDHPAIDILIAQETQATSAELSLALIEGQILRGSHTEQHRQMLLYLGSWDSGLDYDCHIDIAQLLIRGWPRHSHTKEHCLQALDRKGWNSDAMEQSLALRVLLEGYPHDDAVVDYCIRQIEHEQFPFITLHIEGWRLLYHHFQGNQRLTDVIDKWLPQQSNFHFAETVYAALIGRTEVSKSTLLALIEENGMQTGIQWPVSALLDHWGMDDPEIASAITAIVNGREEITSSISHLLPQIINDPQHCRARLLELLQAPGRINYGFVMEGLKRLTQGQSDSEIVDIILSHPWDRDNDYHRELIEAMFANHAADPRVRSMAFEELDAVDGMHLAVAYGFGHDDEVRAKILTLTTPLPVILREQVAIALGESSGDNDYILGLLAYYDADPDVQVKTQMSIAYHQRLQDSGQDVSHIVQQLQSELQSVGFEAEYRRPATFCGLTVLQRLDVVQDVLNTNRSKLIWSLNPIHKLQGNIPFIRFLLQNWDDLKSTFANDVLSLFASNDIEARAELWELILPFIDDAPTARADAEIFVEQVATQRLRPNSLRFLGQIQPSSVLLLERCLAAVKVNLHYHWSEAALVGAELLGAHFAGDQAILARLYEEGQESGWYEGQIIALCEGWPESTMLEHFVQRLREQDVPRSYVLQAHLMIRKGGVEELMQLVDDFSRRKHLPGRRIVLPRLFIRRLRDDDTFLSALWERLQNRPTIAEKLTFPYLISSACGLSQKLRIWCLDEIERQSVHPRETLPQIGVNILTGEVWSVTQALLAVLASQTTSAEAI